MKKIKNLLYFFAISAFFGLSASVENKANAETIFCALISTQECHTVCTWLPTGLRCETTYGLRISPPNQE